MATYTTSRSRGAEKCFMKGGKDSGYLVANAPNPHGRRLESFEFGRYPKQGPFDTITWHRMKKNSDFLAPISSSVVCAEFSGTPRLDLGDASARQRSNATRRLTGFARSWQWQSEGRYAGTGGTRD
jgi:hypothetical protein